MPHQCRPAESLPSCTLGSFLALAVCLLPRRSSLLKSLATVVVAFGSCGMALAQQGQSSAGIGTPQDVGAQKPSLVAGIECPADILEATANPSKQLVDSVAQFSATEHVVHERFSPQGTPKSRETRQFDYVASISEGAQGLRIDEYREPQNLDNLGIKTTGLAALAIAFHPFFHDDFELHCEGLGDWNGQASWLVFFRQLENRPSRLRAYVVEGNLYPVYIKGRAWIGADNLQIVHVETDLLRPIPAIGLITEHTSVSYGPVEFKRHGTSLWLPKSAELYARFKKGSFRRSESFDHFKLFAIDAAYKVTPPKSDFTESPTSDQGAATHQ